MKNIIRQNFDRASITYSQYDDVQKKAAFDLVSKMMSVCPNLNPDKILDIGCGTGNLIRELYKIFPQSAYHINDISASMLERTVKKFENKIDFKTIHGDVERLNLRNNYDVIVSNMCLQWSDDLNLVIENLLKHTKILVFSCLLKDSFKEWYDLLEKHDIQYASRLYPSQKEIHSLINKLNKNILHESQNNSTRSFCNAKESVKYLRNIGANSSKSSISDFVKVRSFLKTHDKICNLRYNLGFFIIEDAL